MWVVREVRQGGGGGCGGLYIVYNIVWERGLRLVCMGGIPLHRCVSVVIRILYRAILTGWHGGHPTSHVRDWASHAIERST